MWTLQRVWAKRLKLGAWIVQALYMFGIRRFITKDLAGMRKYDDPSLRLGLGDGTKGYGVPLT